MRARKSVLITDLDNTLYDWVADWSAHVGAVLRRVVDELFEDRDAALGEIRSIFTRHGTDEYAFLLEDLVASPSLADRPDARDRMRSILAASVESREHLRCYPGVVDCLERVRNAGSLVVAYTESMACYTIPRLHRLGIGEYFSVVFTRESHQLRWSGAPGADQMTFSTWDPRGWRRDSIRHRCTPIHALKPNPRLLAEILDHVGADREQSVYVGDSLRKDVAMAQEAGVADVHARYGLPGTQDRERYEWLQAISRLTSDGKAPPDDVAPTFTLEAGFEELLDLFAFEPFVPAARPPPSALGSRSDATS